MDSEIKINESQKITEQVLTDLGLNDKEVLAYLSITGRGAVSVGEISIHAQVPEREAENIVKKLLEIGLLKEIPGKIPRYQAIPPYTALLRQLDEFQEVIKNLRQTVPEELKSQFSKFVDSMGEITGLQDFLDYVRLIKDEVPKAMVDQFNKFESEFEKFKKIDQFADFIRKQKSKLGLKNPEVEVLVIHVKSRETGEKETEIKISDKDLPRLRRLAREIDSPENKVKIIVSNLMLREGWDVQNVTITLGLRPFTSKAQILPEQAVGRGLRLMRGISPDHTQTLEVMGTEAFEEFVRELEKEGVGINTVKTPPPLPVTIAPERSRLQYDIEIPQTSLRYTRNYKILSAININNIPSLFNSDKLEEERKILLKLEFMPTGTEVSQVSVDVKILPQGHELLSYIAKEVEKRARLTACFSELYPIVAKYVLEKCFETKLDIEDEKLRKHLNDIKIQEAIMDLLSKEIGRATARTKEISLESEPIKLSKVEPFTWRRKHLRCKKTIFNFVAVYNNFEAEFSQFLDRCPDIERFSALAQIFKIDYLSSKGAIRFYYPDFIAVQKKDGNEVFWIIETKGREYEEVKRKEVAIKKWCNDVSEITKSKWAYLKVPQQIFDSEKSNIKRFADLVKTISKTDENGTKLI